MAEEIEDEASPAEAEAEKKTRFPLNKKMKIILAAAGAVVLLGGGSAFMLSGGSDTEETEHGEAEAEEHGEGAETTLVEVAPLVVNLRSSDGQARFLKLRFMIVASSAEQMAVVQEKLPLVIDRYQPFLRELRPEDLAGSAAVYRLKEELVLRAADVVGPNAISDVLIQDMIQQ